MTDTPRFEGLVSQWRRVPAPLRKTIVATIGATLVLLGIALVVLPGPFTLPLLVLGFAILGSEFAWAARALERTKRGLEASARMAKRAGSKVAGAARRGRRRSEPGDH